MNEFDDTELGRRLHTRLHRETSAIEPRSSLIQAVRSAHRHQVRRRRLLGATAAVVAVGAAGAFALTGPVGTPAAPTSSQGAAAPPMVQVGYVTTRTTEALGDVDDKIQAWREVQHSKADNSTLTYAGWFDPQSGRERLDELDATGKATTTYLKAWPLDGTSVRRHVPGIAADVTVVDHPKRQWRKTTFAAATDPNGTGAPAVPSSENLTPALIEKALNQGGVELVGTEKIDGADVLHLRTARPYHFDIWVDADSYLPVRTMSEGPKARQTFDFQWLPRTPENVKRTVLSTPAGYTQAKD